MSWPPEQTLAAQLRQCVSDLHTIGAKLAAPLIEHAAARIEQLEHDLSLNAAMLAKQCDLAREAEEQLAEVTVSYQAALNEVKIANARTLRLKSELATVAQAERERCAQMCEDSMTLVYYSAETIKAAEDCAKAIRALVPHAGATESGAAQEQAGSTSATDGKANQPVPAFGPTPRTDSAEMPIHHGICHGHVEVDFARQLERENARMRAVVKVAHALCVDWARFPYMHKPTKESDALVAAVRELELTK